MTLRIERTLRLPGKSFLLLGPRGTGKSTLLKMRVQPKVEINLLKSSQFLPLQQNPSLLQDWVAHLKAGDWVIVDEVQKIPALMDEIHFLYEEKGLHFAITGSSARKLKRGGANLLAGRALRVELFPFIYPEFAGRVKLRDVVDWGCLPGVMMDAENRRETLATYVETYLRQELIEEGVIRKLEPFARFLKVAGIYNGQVLNVENIAREAHLKRTTVDSYFEVLEDTLIGHRLPALQLGLHSKEVKHPKFYFFDPGVARASAGWLDETGEHGDAVWRGFAIETWIFNELRAFVSYQKRASQLFYYKATDGVEVDFALELQKKTLSRPRQLLGIEVKSSSHWDRRWSKPLAELVGQSKGGFRRVLGVYFGTEELRPERNGGVEVLPVQTFLERLHSGEITGGL